jgi:hypothetical protein
MAKCPDCGLDLSKFGPRHRCTTKITGARKPTRLEAERTARGEMSEADLLPKDKPAAAQSPGRLAPRSMGNPIHPARQSRDGHLQGQG